jgi:hypothetical protein
MQTTIEKVIEEVKAEFEYSQRWDKARIANNEPEHKMDKNKPVESWILWMDEYLCRARSEATKSTDKLLALHEIRKVANLALACLTYQGCPLRLDEKQDRLDREKKN